MCTDMELKVGRAGGVTRVIPTDDGSGWVCGCSWCAVITRIGITGVCDRVRF